MYGEYKVIMVLVIMVIMYNTLRELSFLNKKTFFNSVLIFW